MNFTLILGLLVGFGGLLFGYLEDEGVISALFKISSASIVFGGTIGYMLVAYPLNYIKSIPKILKLIMFPKKKDYVGIIDLLFNLATVARKDGILAMEAESSKLDDPFLKKGLLFIADGVEPEFLKTVLEYEIEANHLQYERAAMVFEGMGGVAPAAGVLGTVMGMVSILGEMGSDMDELGHKIATAFIATMYGVGSANILWLPLASQIKRCAEAEAAYYELIIEGLLNILEGEYPARMRESLEAKAGDALKKKGSDKGVKVKNPKRG